MKNLFEIKKYFMENYPNYGKIKTISLLPHDFINSKNYMLKSNKGNFVLRYLTNDSSLTQIEKMCKILNHCSSKNACVPEPISNKHGNYTHKKLPIYVTKFYYGHTFSKNTKQIQDFAKNLAILHKILSQNKVYYRYQQNSLLYKILTPNELEEIKKIIHKKNYIDNYDQLIIQNYLFLMGKLIGNRKRSGVITRLNLQKQLIHYDLHPQNILFKNDKVSVILDFNSMRFGYVMEDVSFASFRFAYFTTKDIDNLTKLIHLFLEQYLMYNKIESKQLSQYDYFLSNMLLSRISYILKNRYFHNLNSWLTDLSKNLHFLHSANNLVNITDKFVRSRK